MSTDTVQSCQIRKCWVRGCLNICLQKEEEEMTPNNTILKCII